MAKQEEKVSKWEWRGRRKGAGLNGGMFLGRSNLLHARLGRGSRAWAGLLGKGSASRPSPAEEGQKQGKKQPR